MKFFTTAALSALALPSTALAAAMAGSSEWVLFYDMNNSQKAIGTAMQAKSIIEKAGGEIRCAYGKCSCIFNSPCLTRIAAMGIVLCAEIPDEVLDSIKRLGPPSSILPGSTSPTFPKKGQRMPSNTPLKFLSP